MAKVNVECIHHIDDVWRIRIGDESPAVLDGRLSHDWIYKGMELWNEYDEAGRKVTINRQRVNVKCENFSMFMATLVVRMHDYQIVSAKLHSDGVGIPISSSLRKFTFDAFTESSEE